MTIDELQRSFPDATLDTWHQHPNGRGWVQNTAHVAAGAYVGPSARVCDSALVYDSALVHDSALVYGSARVCGSARVHDSARVCDSALVYGSALVYAGKWSRTVLNAVLGRYIASECGPDLYAYGCRVASYADHVARYKDGAPSDSSLTDEEAAEWLAFLEIMHARQVRGGGLEA